MKNAYLIILFLLAISTPSYAQVMTNDDIIAYRTELQAGSAQQDAYEAMDRENANAYRIEQQDRKIRELQQRLDDPDYNPRYRHYDIDTPY